MFIKRGGNVLYIQFIRGFFRGWGLGGWVGLICTVFEGGDGWGVKFMIKTQT